MDTLLLAKIQMLPTEKQKEVEDFVQFLANQAVAQKPIEPTVMEKRRQAFGVLEPKVFSGTEEF